VFFGMRGRVEFQAGDAFGQLNRQLHVGVHRAAGNQPLPMRRDGPIGPVRAMMRAKNDGAFGELNASKRRRRQMARVDPTRMRNQNARPCLRSGRLDFRQHFIDHAIDFDRLAGIKTAGHGRRPRIGFVCGDMSANLKSLENLQHGVVIFPCVGRQTGFETDLFQKSPGVETMIDSDAGQQQSACAAACDLHAVFADHDRLHALFAPRGNALRSPENPHVDVEAVQFVGRNRGESRIIGRRAIGGHVQRLSQQHIGPEASATCAKPPGAF
jgi:hypothetical protein